MNDTTTNDKCPHCGAGQKPENLQDDHWSVVGEYACGTLVFSGGVLGGDVEQLGRSQCCVEREKRQRAEEQYLEMAEAASRMPDLEAEVERLQANLRRAVEIAEELNKVVPYLVGGPFQMVEKAEQHAKLLAELAAIKAAIK